MSGNLKIEIDLNESFQHLSRAPIIEAVVEVLARASVPIDETAQLKYIRTKLPDYPVTVPQRSMQVGFDLAQMNSAGQTIKDLGWIGHTCHSSDKLQSVQFHRDGFRFSRLAPYENWEKFSQEALRLWEFFIVVAKPLEIQRLGLRFINKIMVPVEGLDFDDYLTAGPRYAGNPPLPFGAFLHTYTLGVPGHPFGLQIIQTILSPQKPTEDQAGLIVDIDAFTGHPFAINAEVLKVYLDQMRWLKNKAFFGSLTSKAIETLK